MNDQAEKKFPISKKIVWNIPSLTSNGLWGIMSGYLTYYLTQSVLLSSASVGIILMGSKVFDGVTDLIAGYIIERTNSKWAFIDQYDCPSYPDCTALYSEIA